MALTAVLAVLATTTYILLPNGDYEPIRPGERGTIGEAVRSLPAAAGGRPAFTPEHATKVAPIPTERERRSPVESQRAPARRADRGHDVGSSSSARRAPSTAGPPPPSPTSRPRRPHTRPDRDTHPDRHPHCHRHARGDRHPPGDIHADAGRDRRGDSLTLC